MNKFKIQNSKLKIAIQNSKFLILTCSFAFCILSFTFTCYAQGEKFFEVRAKKFVYTPHIIKVNKGDLVRIRLISEDVTHGFFLDGYGLNTSTHPGQEGSLKFIADKPGRFTFRCSVTCGEFHPYMVGYLIVEPNLRFYGYVFLVLALGLGGFVIIFKKKEEPEISAGNGK